MVSRKRRRPRVMVNHQQCWLWGRHVVLELCAAEKWKPLEIRLAQDVDAPPIEAFAAEHAIPLRRETPAELTKQCGSREHQGFLARMPEFPYAKPPELFDLHAVAILDGIQDPFNFGAVLRSAEFLGVGGVLVPESGQAMVNRQVVRSSAGAIHHLVIAQTNELAGCAGDLKSRGFRLIAAVEQATTIVNEADLSGRTAFVIGNEGAGISQPLLEACDETVAIPGAGRVNSLNAAVAAGVLFYEAARQRALRDSHPR